MQKIFRRKEWKILLKRLNKRYGSILEFCLYMYYYIKECQSILCHKYFIWRFLWIAFTAFIFLWRIQIVPNTALHTFGLLANRIPREVLIKCFVCYYSNYRFYFECCTWFEHIVSYSFYRWNLLIVYLLFISKICPDLSTWNFTRFLQHNATKSRKMLASQALKCRERELFIKKTLNSDQICLFSSSLNKNFFIHCEWKYSRRKSLASSIFLNITLFYNSK